MVPFNRYHFFIVLLRNYDSFVPQYGQNLYLSFNFLPQLWQYIFFKSFELTCFWETGNNFIYSGEVSGDMVANRDLEGFYWTSTSRGSNVSYGFEIRNQRVYPGSYFNTGMDREYGFSIRCIHGN